jgi:hypothetical protein
MKANLALFLIAATVSACVPKYHVTENPANQYPAINCRRADGIIISASLSYCNDIGGEHITALKNYNSLNSTNTIEILTDTAGQQSIKNNTKEKSNAIFYNNLKKFSFLGVNYEDSMQEVIEKIKQAFESNGITSNSSSSSKQCDSKYQRCRLSHVTIGEISFLEIEFKFNDGGFTSLTASFFGLYTPSLINALRERYGKPSDYFAVDMQNIYGAKFKNHTYDWKFREGVLRLSQSGNPADKTDMFFFREHERTSPKNRVKAKDVF